MAGIFVARCSINLPCDRVAQFAHVCGNVTNNVISLLCHKYKISLGTGEVRKIPKIGGEMGKHPDSLRPIPVRILKVTISLASAVLTTTCNHELPELHTHALGWKY